MYVLILVESVKEERVIECRTELGEFERMILPRLEKRTGILKLPNNERVDLTHLVTWQLCEERTGKIVRSDN